MPRATPRSIALTAAPRPVYQRSGQPLPPPPWWGEGLPEWVARSRVESCPPNLPPVQSLHHRRKDDRTALWREANESDPPLHKLLTLRHLPGAPFTPFWFRLQTRSLRKPRKGAGALLGRSATPTISSVHTEPPLIGGPTGRRRSIAERAMTPTIYSFEEMEQPPDLVPHRRGPTGRRRSLAEIQDMPATSQELKDRSAAQFKSHASKYGYAGKVRSM